VILFFNEGGELILPKVWPVISAMVGKGKSIMVASRGKKPELLAEGLVSDSSSSRPWGEHWVSKTCVVLYYRNKSILIPSTVLYCERFSYCLL
jgi:hypothetical protein